MATMELAFVVAMIVVAKLKTKEVEVLYTPLHKSKGGQFERRYR
ncbi:hypothetical protein [Enterovibrio baiacu]|nr:hypothetical protein [Enterovibrio baiacu]